jgi:3'(2'), 5'-bisphosphate nucleotidase
MAILKNADCYWIVDPLDGTRSYIDGHDGFGVHIALIQNERPVLAVIYFPARKVFYYTDDEKAYLEREGQKPIVINGRDRAPDESLKVAVSWLKDKQPKLQGVGYQPIPAVGGDRVCEVAVGRADLALIENPFSYWDLAAAHALLLQAGGEIYDLETGKPVRYTNDKLFVKPCLAGKETVVKNHLEKFKDELGALQRKRPAFKQKP